ncbi:MAG TPA: NAD(P)-binding domain-containing protein [Burkholderiaceae bacterium]|nr:NAD(P)-binding domain-containing protein [Burkholderiaceae bacterium]
MANVGFIGLGSIAPRMAKHLAPAGHTLFVFDRAKTPVELTIHGAITCGSPRDVAQCADIVIAIAAGDDMVEGENGLLRGLAAGKTVVDLSDRQPLATQAFAHCVRERGCEYLGAPVSGGDAVAATVRLPIRVGGSRAAFEKLQRLFEGTREDPAFGVQ